MIFSVTGSRDQLLLPKMKYQSDIDKDTDQAIVDNDITSSYELNQRPNRLAADTSTLIRRHSGLV